MSAPKKVLQKRNRNQAGTIEELSEEVSRLTRENIRFAEFVRWVVEDSEDEDAPLRDKWPDVLERAGIRG